MLPDVEARYLKKVSTGRILPWTEFLSKKGDMIECDLQGNPVDTANRQKGLAYYEQRVSQLETENENLKSEIVRLKSAVHDNAVARANQQHTDAPDQISASNASLPGEPSLRALINQGDIEKQKAKEELAEIAKLSEDIRERARIEDQIRAEKAKEVEEEFNEKINKKIDENEKEMEKLFEPPEIDPVVNMDLESEFLKFGNNKKELLKFGEEMFSLRIPGQSSIQKIQKIIRAEHTGNRDQVPAKYRMAE